jgi:hypothetical protein
MTRQRLRKLIGAVLLVAFVSVYALAAMTVAALTLPDESRAVQLLYYVVAGLAWVVPAALLIRWMESPRGRP